MKKIYFFSILFAVLLTAMGGCDDNTDFSSEYILTAEEIAELARQDSIREAQKENIDANLILRYDAKFNVSASLYDGTSVPIEIDKIAEIFGLSEEQVLAGIAGESGAPEIKPFAINWSTRADNATASTTNATWGHWWDANGDVTSWGTGAVAFCEFDTETGEFYVGQYPGGLVTGDTVSVIEALRYNDIRVAVVISIIPTEPGQITAPVVFTQDITFNVAPKSDYTASPVDFDLDQVLNELGIASMDEVTFLGVNEDGTYSQETVTGNGFWYDLNGYVGSWGDNASVYTNYGEFESNQISIGQFPGRLQEGETYTIKYGFLANDKIAMLNITINIVSYIDPETAPEGDPEPVTIDVELSKPYSTDYASVTYDVKETLRNAFKMTTYQIYRAIVTGDLKLYQGEVTDTDPSYTGDAPGYWLTADGSTGTWAESVVWISLGHSETELYLYGGNHPDNAETGDEVTTKYIAVCNGVQVTFNITFQLTE